VADPRHIRRVNPRNSLADLPRSPGIYWRPQSVNSLLEVGSISQRMQIAIWKLVYIYAHRVWPPITRRQTFVTHTDALDELAWGDRRHRDHVQPLDQFLRDRLVRFGHPAQSPVWDVRGRHLGVLIQDVSGDSTSTI